MIQVRKNKIPLEKADYKVLAVIMASLIMAFIVSSFVISVNRVVGESMEPTLYENEWVIVNRLAYMNSFPSFNDVIIFHKKDISNDIIVKRVVAVSGDSVEIKNGILIINGKIINDGFEMNSNECMERMIVNKDCYFVLGDNRNKSNDSRYWENPFVDKKNIIGKVVF